MAGNMSMEQQQIVQQFQKMRSELNGIHDKITEIEGDYREHELALKAMSKVEPSRRCYRLVGGVLVERTVAEVSPALQENMKSIVLVVEKLKKVMSEKEEQLEKFQAEYQIKIADEDQ